MTLSPSCPPTSDYEAMLLGRLDADRDSALEAHVETCQTCQRVLDGLAVNPRLTDALRSGPVPLTDFSVDPSLGDLVSRLEDMSRQFTPCGFDLSASGAAADGLPEPDDLRQMGAYRIERLLGAGGMGLVYLAEDEVLRRRVAVKMLRPRLARLEKARDGFLREARAMASLKHDNVVTVFQVGEADGPGDGKVPFLAMELLEGESLAHWLRREGPIAPAWAVRIARQAAEGLAAAHRLGVVHRDVKPGNLWLETPASWAEVPPEKRPPLPSAARVKVLDFGLAQPAGQDETTDGDQVFGTPAYMAPEQATRADVDHRADLFSLGVVMYEMVSGKLPFPREGRRATPTYPVPVPVADLVPNLSSAFAALIHRLLSVDPKGRPSSAREVVRELISLVPSSTETMPVQGAFTMPMPAGRRGRPLPAAGLAVVAASALAGLAAVVVAVVVIGMATRPAPEPSPVEPPPGLLGRPGPPDDAWIKAVSAAPAEQQFAAVVAKLRELNPGYVSQGATVKFADDKVSEIVIPTDDVRDLRPVKALTGLRLLTVAGGQPGKGKLTDLSPIRGLSLTVLNVWNNPDLADISAARGMNLVLFQAGDTAIEDLRPLEGMPIATLAVNNCRVRDLSPVRTMSKLRYLRCDGCPIASLTPLAGAGVTKLLYTPEPGRDDLAALEQATALEIINNQAAIDFRRQLALPR